MGKERGKWRVIEDNSDTPIAFGDAGWEAFKVVSGSNIFKNPEFAFLDPISDTLSQFEAYSQREIISGTIPTWLLAPATRGTAPEINLLLKALFGQVLTTSAMAGLADGPSANEILVTTVDPNLPEGGLVYIGLDTGDFATFVTGISIGTGPAGEDVLTIHPDIPGGSTISATEIPAGVYYEPLTGANSGEYPKLQIQRLWEDTDELFTWTECKIGNMTIDAPQGEIIQPSFDIVGIDETKATETGTITEPSVSNFFVMKNAFIQLDQSDIIWVGNVNISYNNSLAQIVGAEAATGIAGHGEDRRIIEISTNFREQNLDDRDKYVAATKREFMCYMSKDVSGTTMYLAFYAPNMLQTTFDNPLEGKDRKVDITARCFPTAQDVEDEFVVSIV